MKIADARSAYEALSAKVSDIVRQMGIAGIALAWLFRSGEPSTPTVDQHLLRAMVLIAIALVADFLQYLSGTVIWYYYFRYKEKLNTGIEDEFLAPDYINVVQWVLFFAKSVLILLAYLSIFKYLWPKFVA